MPWRSIAVEVIHVVGMSCCGKETLIQRLIDSNEVELRKRFGVSGSTAVFLDKNHERFKSPLALSEQQWLSSSSIHAVIAHRAVDHLIHKWQYGTKDLAKDIQENSPSVFQRAIVLWIPEDQRIARCKDRRSSWSDNEKWECIRSYVRSLEKIQVPCELIDSRGEKYLALRPEECL